MRVRNLSRSPVEYKLSKTRPNVLRMKSIGSLARFSAQSVSIMPKSCWSVASKKPFSCQNSLMGSHTFSAGRSITSQRWLPARSIRTSPKDKGAVPDMAVFLVPAA